MNTLDKFERTLENYYDHWNQNYFFTSEFLCHLVRCFATNKHEAIEASTKVDQKMKKLSSVMRLGGRVATVILLSPTDGALWTGTALAGIQDNYKPR
jgi:hypothetical protein